MKHQGYIRSLFVAFCAFFVCVSAMAETFLNPFAYRLDNMVDRNTGITDDSKGLLMNDHYVIKYALSGPATSVIVSFWDDDNSTWSRDGGNTGTALFKFNITDEKDNTQQHYCKDKGYHEYTIDFTHVIGQNPNLDMQKVRWTIDVKGGNQNGETTTKSVKINANGTSGNRKFINAQEVTEYKGFRTPGSVDICNDPYSHNFGVVLCTESRRSYDGNDNSNYVSHGEPAGVYVFGGGMERLYANWEGNNIACYGGGISFEKAYAFQFLPRAPRRVRFSDDGRVFISVTAGNNNILQELYQPANADGNNFYEPPTSGGKYYNIFNGGTWDSDDLILNTTGSKFIASPNVGMDVRGSGSDLEILLLSANQAQSKYSVNSTIPSGNEFPGVNQSEWHLDKYNLGTSTAWGDQASSKQILETIKTNHGSPTTNTLTNKLIDTQGRTIGDAMLIGYDQTGIEYDANGGCWIVQARDNDGVGATMVHYNTKTGKIDFEEHVSGRSSGGVRHNHNFSKLVVAGGHKVDSTFKYTKSGTNVTQTYNGQGARKGHITIYSVSYNANGSYNFTDSAYIETKTSGFHDFAWDFADNLYVVASSSNRLMAFALPHKDKTVSTPCREVYEYKMAPVHKFLTTVNPTVDGADTYASIIHVRIGQAPYQDYLQNAKMDLRADVINGCKFYQWTTYGWDNGNKVLRTYPSYNDNKFLVDALTEQLEVTAEIGICVYEEEAPLVVKAETPFPAAFVKRELDDISYSTICLPFHLESLAGTPYQGASVLELESSTTNTDGDSRVFLNFKEVEFGAGKGIRAGKPYLIKLTSAIASGVEKIFNNVTCPVLTGTNAHGGLDVACGNGIIFHGMLNPTTFKKDETKDEITDKLFLTADNRLVSIYGQQENVTINGLRGYFTVSGGLAKTAEFVLNLPEKVTTSIPMVSLADSLKVTKYLWNGQIYIQRGNEVYDLSGARVK